MVVDAVVGFAEWGFRVDLDIRAAKIAVGGDGCGGVRVTFGVVE